MSIIISFVSKRGAQKAVKLGFHCAWISVFLDSVRVFVGPTRTSIRNNIKSFSNVCFCASYSFPVLYIKVEHKLACWFILSTFNYKLEGWREGWSVLLVSVPNSYIVFVLYAGWAQWSNQLRYQDVWFLTTWWGMDQCQSFSRVTPLYTMYDVLKCPLYRQNAYTLAAISSIWQKAKRQYITLMGMQKEWTGLYFNAIHWPRLHF